MAYLALNYNQVIETIQYVQPTGEFSLSIFDENVFQFFVAC